MEIRKHDELTSGCIGVGARDMLAHLKMNIFAAPQNPNPLSPLDFPQVSGNLLKEGVNSEMLNMLVTAIE